MLQMSKKFIIPLIPVFQPLINKYENILVLCIA